MGDAAISEPGDTRVPVKMQRDVYEQLKQAAQREQRTVTNLLHFIAKRWLADQGEAA